MPLNIKCLKCRQPIHTPGAILLSPPFGGEEVMSVSKLHICVTCYIHIRDWLLEPYYAERKESRSRKEAEQVKRQSNLRKVIKAQTKRPHDRSNKGRARAAK